MPINLQYTNNNQILKPWWITSRNTVLYMYNYDIISLFLPSLLSVLQLLFNVITEVVDSYWLTLIFQASHVQSEVSSCHHFSITDNATQLNEYVIFF